MTTLVSVFLTLLVSYGYITVAVVVFLSGLGLPLPASTLVLAAGSFTVDTTLRFWPVVFLVSFSTTLGDVIAYSVARRFGAPVTIFIQRFGITAHHLSEVDKNLERWGVWYIFFSRWLVTPLCPPVNFASGLRKYSFVRFVSVVFVGEFVWAYLFTALGNAFGASWPSLVTFLSGAPELLALIVLGVVFAALALRIIKRKRISVR